ncbi:hypothetical protein Sjap_021730 [Stephania japonica]|uniref:FAR1 domain-containing protein n=1 Tax=Stephania japonica TaxID=461633 RepID=A0AAP0EUQ0_9MAGN
MECIIDLNEPMESLIDLIDLDYDHGDNLHCESVEAQVEVSAELEIERSAEAEVVGSVSTTATATAPAPEMGMICDSPEEVKLFFNQYAKRIGFAIKVRSTNKYENGVVWKYVFTCSKQGHNISKGVYRRGGLTQCVVVVLK